MIEKNMLLKDSQKKLGAERLQNDVKIKELNVKDAVSQVLTEHKETMNYISWKASDGLEKRDSASNEEKTH